jgi:hypothetical protein
MIKFFQKLAGVLAKKANIFAKFFVENDFKNRNIGPCKAEVAYILCGEQNTSRCRLPCPCAAAMHKSVQIFEGWGL